MSAIQHRVAMMIGRVVIAGVDDAPKMQQLQVELLADETIDGVEHVQPYGFAAHPFPDAEGIGLAVGGLRSHLLVINAADRRYRIKLEQGEVAIHDDQGQSVVLKRDGVEIHAKKITMVSDDAIELTGTSFKVTADQVEIASDDVKIGNGATKAAARVDDDVNDGTDKISSGSSKVKIG